MRERTDLDKKPTWYIFLFANVAVVLGCVITYLVFRRENTTNAIINYVPSIVCNIVSLFLCAFFIWLEAKNTMPKAVHFQRKWLKWYLAAIIVYICSIIFNFSFLIIFVEKFYWPNKIYWPLIVYMVVTAVLTLAAIGLQRFARYKIDLDIYRRNRGELPKKEEMEKDKIKLEQKQKNDTPKASSGLTDSIDKQ